MNGTTHANTHRSDDICEQITEVPSNKGVKGYSLLEHKWLFNVTGGTRVFFHVEARFSGSTDNDTFEFYYSTDDVTYSYMLTLASASEQVYERDLTSGNLSGTVYVKVIDTDQTPKNTTADTVYIDEMYMKSTIVPNNPPIAVAGGPYLGSEDTPVEFDGSGSYDPNGDSLTYYLWDFGDDTTEASVSPICDHTYTAGGTYTVTLVVNDGLEDSQTIVIQKRILHFFSER